MTSSLGPLDQLISILVVVLYYGLGFWALLTNTAHLRRKLGACAFVSESTDSHGRFCEIAK
jgi:hypothetical protein